MLERQGKRLRENKVLKRLKKALENFKFDRRNFKNIWTRTDGDF